MRSRASLACALALGLWRTASAAETSAPPQNAAVFAESQEIFSPLLADPRETQLSASYYRRHGDNLGEVALGHSWGMSRWYAQHGKWAFQWDIEGMAYSQFQVSGSVNKFETVDF